MNLRTRLTELEALPWQPEPSPSSTPSEAVLADYATALDVLMDRRPADGLSLTVGGIVERLAPYREIYRTMEGG